MRIKKKLLLIAFAAAVVFGATAPPASADILCDTEATSFNHWFYKQFYC
jgi:hypothetical protein